MGKSGWGQAVCAGDYDNDGFPDLFVTYWGDNVLYRNLGNGTFADVTRQAGLVQPARRWNSGCAFLDFDRDGDLDLFVANYIDFEPATTPTPDSGLRPYKGIRVACGPPGLTGGKNLLYQNNGNATFTDVSRTSGIIQAHGTYGLGALVSDFDGDGWPDIYVANDSNPSALYHNNRNGTFTDIGILAGCAYSADGKPQAGMGVTAGDFNHDGWMDIFETNFAGDTSNLYQNNGKGGFEENTFSRRYRTQHSIPGLGLWIRRPQPLMAGSIFVQVNGHVYPEVNQLKMESPVSPAEDSLSQWEGKRFEDVTEQVGGPLLDLRAARGCAFGDIDNDGDTDLVVNNVNQTMDLYRLDRNNNNHWTTIQLSASCNRSAIGARVRILAGDLAQIDRGRSSSSFSSRKRKFRSSLRPGASKQDRAS